MEFVRMKASVETAKILLERQIERIKQEKAKRERGEGGADKESAWRRVVEIVLGWPPIGGVEARI